MAKKSSGVSEVHGFISVDRNNSKAKVQAKSKLINKNDDKKDPETSKIKKSSNGTISGSVEVKPKTSNLERKIVASKEVKKEASTRNISKSISTKERKKNETNPLRSSTKTSEEKQPSSKRSVDRVKTSISNVETQITDKRKTLVPKKPNLYEARKSDSNIKKTSDPAKSSRSILKNIETKMKQDTKKTNDSRRTFKNMKHDSSKPQLRGTLPRSNQTKSVDSGTTLKKKEAHLGVPSSVSNLDVSSDKREYKDVIYFEVDAPRSGPKKQKESSPPPLLSRQGTFTKENEEVHVPPQLEDEEEEYQYEDDFEDYESDFEEYVSESGLSSDSESRNQRNNAAQSDERNDDDTNRSVSKRLMQEQEKKLDSGNYDLTSKIMLPECLKRQQLDDIKEAISNENKMLTKSEVIENKEREEVDLMQQRCLDFKLEIEKQEKAMEEQKLKEIKQAETETHMKSRSSLIMKMVGLIEDKLNLFEMKSLPYELFMELYGNKNKKQVGVDSMVCLSEAEVQTVSIKTRNMWTQFPCAFHDLKGAETDVALYIEDIRGFGGDKSCPRHNKVPSYNYENFINFLSSAGQVILTLLQEEELDRMQANQLSFAYNNSEAFSSGYSEFNIERIDFLKDRVISDILFSPHHPNLFISCHEPVERLETLQSYDEQSTGRSIMCLWNVMHSSDPQIMMVASCKISALCFDNLHPYLIFAGLSDGAVCLWDLSVRSVYHKETIACGVKYTLQPPTYITPFEEIMECADIVSMKSFSYDKHEQKLINKNIPTQLVTLDSEGLVTVWILVNTQYRYTRHIPKEEMERERGLSYWGAVKIVRTSTFSRLHYLPFKEVPWSIAFLCMERAPQSERSVLIGTNAGCVVQCPLSGRKPNKALFDDSSPGSQIVAVLCIECCPHNFSLFLVGCDNGTIRLHDMNRRRPFKVFVSEKTIISAPIENIRWSVLRPGLFFAQTRNQRLHIWDIIKSDSCPQLTVSMTDRNATQMALANDMKLTFLGFVVNKNKVQVHSLHDSFIPDDFTISYEEFNNFNLYINRYMR